LILFFFFPLLPNIQTYLKVILLAAIVINKIVPHRDIQGKVYKFKNNSEYLGLGILTPVIPDIIRGYMVLVLGIIPGKSDYIKIMIISA
jgi:hypothetical protein